MIKNDQYLNRVAVRNTPAGISVTRFGEWDLLHYGFGSSLNTLNGVDFQVVVTPENEDAFIAWYMALRFPGEAFTVISEDNIPKRPDGQWDRSQRDEWSLKAGKVEVDSEKVVKKQEKEARRQAVLLKMGVTEQELKELLHPESVKESTQSEHRA